LRVGTPESAALVVRQAAQAFVLADGSVKELWSTLHSSLHDLCRDHPLEGDYLRLFEALEHWEKSVALDRSDADLEIHQIAERLPTG
jgi:hypothetical protein